MKTIQAWLDWFFHDRRSGRIVIAQWPNLALWIFGAAWLVAWVAGPGRIGAAARLVASVSLIVWATDELLRGVNPWRRCLGLAVLAWTVWGWL